MSRNAASGTVPAEVALTPRRVVPGWLVIGSFVLTLLGLALSAYLTYEHFTASATLACPLGETFNCAKVTQSQWAYLFGIPVALLGLLYFAAMTALCMPGVWRRPEVWLDRVRLAMAILGVVFVAYLVWAEVAKIGSICLWCTVVHVVTFVLFCVVLFGQIMIDPPPVPPTPPPSKKTPSKKTAPKKTAGSARVTPGPRPRR